MGAGKQSLPEATSNLPPLPFPINGHRGQKSTLWREFHKGSSSSQMPTWGNAGRHKAKRPRPPPKAAIAAIFVHDGRISLSNPIVGPRRKREGSKRSSLIHVPSQRDDAPASGIRHRASGIGHRASGSNVGAAESMTTPSASAACVGPPSAPEPRGYPVTSPDWSSEIGSPTNVEGTLKSALKKSFVRAGISRTSYHVWLP